MSEALNIVKASFGGLREVATAPLWQWDYGQILRITGLDLPQAFEVHFSNSRKSGETVTQIGTDNQVVIPDMHLTSGADIYAFVFLHDGTDDGETEYVIKIPVRERPEPSDIEPTPEQQDAITEAIAALNVAVTQTGEDKAATAALAEAAAASSLIATEAAQSAQASATSASGSATTATNAAQTATAKASEAAISAANAANAKTSAETAQGKAEAAQTASESAQASAQSAANTATSKASEAAASAASVGEAAQTATAKAAEASASATSASGSATAAAGSATTASTKASEAAASASAASNAQTAAETAQGKAEDAQTAAEAARNKAEEAAASVSGALDDKADVIIRSVEGSLAHFEDGGNNMPMVSCVAKIEPVQDLHGYGHPWPAGGGKNLLNNTAGTTTNNGVTFTVNSDGTVLTSGTANGTAVLRIYQTFSVTSDLIISGCPSGGGVITGYSLVAASSFGARIGEADVGDGGTILAAKVSEIAQVQIIVRNGTNVDGKVFKPMIRLASVEDDTYAPYSNICPISGWTGANVVVSPTEFAEDGTTYPITFPSEAGTVYGGTLDVVSGALTVTHGEIDSYAGETLPSVWISDRDVYAEGTTPTTGAQVVYELATPQTYQLTPVEVKTLLGLNNVWADTGDVEVQYRADTKLYIDGKGTDFSKLIAPTEANYKATRAYTSGSLLIVGSQLYKATTSIANGATLTVGTNITATTLAEVIAAL